MMKYYDEKKMAEIRKTFEKEVLNWKGVTSRQMMGCLCYLYNRKFIGFLVNTRYCGHETLRKRPDSPEEEVRGKPFEMSGQTGNLWVTPLKSPKM